MNGTLGVVVPIHDLVRVLVPDVGLRLEGPAPAQLPGHDPVPDLVKVLNHEFSVSNSILPSWIWLNIHSCINKFDSSIQFYTLPNISILWFFSDALVPLVAGYPDLDEVTREIL